MSNMDIGRATALSINQTEWRSEPAASTIPRPLWTEHASWWTASGRGASASSRPVGTAGGGELAPSKELRQWFAHDPSRWEGFKERYFAELDAKHEALSVLAEASRGGRLTLLFAARDPVHNNAVALREYLLRASKMTRQEIGEEPD